jgi:peptidoglycan/LPS O-acetylase OafA/YrhL
MKRGNGTMETQQARAPHPPNSPTAAGERAVPPASRWYYLDWLRVLAILIVFLYHVTIIFDYGSSSMIRNPQLDWGLSIVARILELWGMPLFFVLAAAAVFFSLTSRDNRHFLTERFKRLIIPFLFGVFVLSPPLVYLERISQGQFRGSFWQFLPHYFDGWYGFGGNFVWFGFHLWFLVLLFLFSLLFLPLFRYLKRSNLVPAVLHKLPWLQGELFLIVPVVLTAIIETLVNLQPDTWGARIVGGWSLFTFLAFFLCGYLLALNPKVLGSFERYRVSTLLLGMGTTLIYIVLVHGGYGYSSYTVPFSVLRALNVWLWIATLLGFTRRYLNVNTPLRAEANQAVLPFYILHAPVIILVAFVLIPWTIPVLAKFGLIAVVSLVIILGLYLIIRRVPFLRFLFGMKARGKKTLQVSPS